ncbi:uncharacterized protein LOC130629106 [Hydractinia symbiolongicarpus]|uniref:uncharacterized protein LOC130629106 n=1 Tax=Hydractinia symbiolongicarpus TaxID=13093 RepID=UPI00254A8C62|nr:uncharacterized protein LOC130629106 [Hydractinia symbiolongicarpus]
MHVVRVHRNKVALILLLTMLLVTTMLQSIQLLLQNQVMNVRIAIKRMSDDALRENEILKQRGELHKQSIESSNKDVTDGEIFSPRKTNSLAKNKVEFSESFDSTSTGYTLLILTFGGMELTISLDALNNNNGVIYWHEPMKIWERIHERWSGSDLKIYKTDPLRNFKYSNPNSIVYNSTAEFYNELFSCRFSLKIEPFISEAAKICPDLLVQSGAISKLLGCFQQKAQYTCAVSKATATEMNKMCSMKKHNVIVKESEESLHSLQILHQNLKDNIRRSLKVLHLVRDPRGVLFDFSHHGRVPTNVFRTDFREQVEFVCNRLITDFTFGEKKLRFTNEYALYRYEDVEINFEKIFRNVLKIKTSQSEYSREKRINYTKLNANWWRKNIPMQFSASVENICWESITSLHYAFVGLQEERMRGSAPLID